MMAATAQAITGDIDTHKGLHTAAVLGAGGAVLGVRSFTTTRQGYNLLVAWMQGFGRVAVVGVESSGSYGAGITRRLAREAIGMLQVAGRTAAPGAGAERTTTWTPWRRPARPRGSAG